MVQERSAEDNILTRLDEISSRLATTQRFDSGWGVRLRLATMEGAAEAAAYQFLDRSLSPQRFMPSVGGWSIQYQVIASVVDYVLHSGIEDPLIVELGSGVSTSWLGLTLKKLGRGRLISVEHDPKFAKITQRSISRFELSDFVEIALVDLQVCKEPYNDFTWYAPEPIIERFGINQKIDLLLVDGPPGNAGPKSRYPAFPMMQVYLSTNSMIVLDDTDRKHEQDICIEWIAECSEHTPERKLEIVETIGRCTWMEYSQS